MCKLPIVLCKMHQKRLLSGSGVAKGGAWGVVRPWRHFYRGGTMGFAVGCKPEQGVLK